CMLSPVEPDDRHARGRRRDDGDDEAREHDLGEVGERQIVLQGGERHAAAAASAGMIGCGRSGTTLCESTGLCTRDSIQMPARIATAAAPTTATPTVWLEKAATTS